MVTAKRREDYIPPYFSISRIHLDFVLDREQTRVTNTMQVKRLKDTSFIHLDGVGLTIISVKIDDEQISDYTLTEHNLSIPVTKDAFTLTIQTECNPQANTELEGLYFAADSYCTQCEAEGFRRITYFLDRPDVMSEYSVTITANQSEFPYLLSNGNKIQAIDNHDGTHTVSWHDPHLKPCYLFALVAGDFDLLEGTFTTQEGRDVVLQMFVEKGRKHQAQHALDSLVKSMQWDEQTYGLCYDLDIYMIVATDFFNMGAMENKGLNVFNSKFVLADAETATDEDYYNIESVIAHEYFHNWTGNRVTCRDWFQLSLKEGLTVFRDQQFSADVMAPLTTRIKQINLMRAQQFAEDASAMAHPIRPDEVIEMNNFYTLTVYDKGAEVIRMQQILLGEEGFKKGLALYFDRHDGQAVTCDDFVNAMADANQYDMTLFKRWYAQSGTPVVTTQRHYDEVSKTLTITLEQHTPQTADQVDKLSLVIPLVYECVDKQCNHYQAEQNTRDNLVVLNDSKMEVTFVNVPKDTQVLFNVGFSAPVKIKNDYSLETWQQLFINTRSPYAVWEASQVYLQQIIQSHYEALLIDSTCELKHDYFVMFYQFLERMPSAELISEVLCVPSIEAMLSVIGQVDLQVLLVARNNVEVSLARTLRPLMEPMLAEIKVDEDYVYDAAAVQNRKLKSTLHYYLALADANQLDWLSLYQSTSNMTERLSVLRTAQRVNAQEFHALLAIFNDSYQSDSVVMDKWFALQATQDSDDILSQLDLLQTHPLFALNNPNKVRALIGNFAFYNHRHFHNPNGSGYAYLANFIMRFDSVNAQVAARLVTPLTQWQQVSSPYRELMIHECRRVLDKKDLSKDVFEKVSKSVLQYESLT